jgi:hypothetical protein
MLGIGAVAGVSLRWDNGRILMSERGGPYTEIRLGENEEAAKLRALLVESGALEAVPVVPTIVADGGQSPSWPRKDEPVESPKDSDKPLPKDKQAEPPKSG